MARARREVEDDQARPALLARQQNERADENHDIDEIAAVAVGDDLAPVRLGGIGARRLDDLEVAGAGVGADEDPVAVVEHVVEMTRPARRDEERPGRRRVEIDDHASPSRRGRARRSSPCGR